MKIYTWTFGKSVKENVQNNLMIDILNSARAVNSVEPYLDDGDTFDFAPYIKNEYNNEVPLGVGQKVGCQIYTGLSKI